MSAGDKKPHCAPPNHPAPRLPRRVLRADNSWQKGPEPSSVSPPPPPPTPLRLPKTRATSSEPKGNEDEPSAEAVAYRRLSLACLESSPEAPSNVSDCTPEALLRTFGPLKEGSPIRLLFLLARSRKINFNMDHLRPQSASAMTAHRREAVRLAQEQQRAVVEKCKRAKQPEPDYTFDELIGKGSFGRVYKGRQIPSQQVVAIKVLDIDDADFRAYGEQKDEQIRDFQREIRILRQAQESGAENLNQLIDAFPVHSQLWMICEHCPGGSVKTLMRANKDRLEEKYLIVVARELAKALKGLHEAGILHRDVKAANVLIHEEGRLQLCDFGVANVLDNQADRRNTFIGTLHWMAPEQWTDNPEYSDEVDVWGYGCTLYECAVGRPPNSDLRERQQLKLRMRRLKQAISLPEDQDHSDGLRSLVSSSLTPDVATRPSMQKVLQHDFLKDTEETHPTSILTELVQKYYTWVVGGGQRVSLFMPGGAAAASMDDLDSDLDTDEWNFSMTQDFEKRASAVLEIPDFSDMTTNERTEGEATPRGPARSEGLSLPNEMTAVQKANFEARVQRGAGLSNLFDHGRPDYKYETKRDFIPIPEQRRISDLPLRNMAEDRPSSIASNVIDLGDFDEADYAIAAPRTDDKIQTAYAGTPLREETIRLADASTLRDKRANSKGPRDPNNKQSLTARRTSSAEELPPSTSAHDFATSQEEWTVKNNNHKVPELQEAAEITSSRPGHDTMDWSFASAMSEAVIPQINEPENAEDDAPGPADTANDTRQKTKKHATMDWSFSSAMAAANTNDTDEMIDSSPPAQPMAASRPTPTRPAPLMRQMTMPVTFDDFVQAEEQEIPRPSTALSEAYSDVSASSTDVDPFGLERDEDDHPGPATMDEDVPMGRFYATRGRTMFSGRSDSLNANSSTTTPGLAPFNLGHPARIGENGRGLGGNTATANGERQVVNVPHASPPSAAVMGAGASTEDMEAELIRLLEGMQGTLNAARDVVGGLERRGVESEWEDFEE